MINIDRVIHQTTEHLLDVLDALQMDVTISNNVDAIIKAYRKKKRYNIHTVNWLYSHRIMDIYLKEYKKSCPSDIYNCYAILGCVLMCHLYRMGILAFEYRPYSQDELTNILARYHPNDKQETLPWQYDENNLKDEQSVAKVFPKTLQALSEMSLTHDVPECFKQPEDPKTQLKYPVSYYIDPIYLSITFVW